MACIDKGDIVGSIFIDFRKAFDLVDHKTLIRKLSTYKCSQSSLQLFISYLESRQQTIDYGHGTSLLSFIKSGVPQGSILGPLVFLLFINDLPLLLKHCFSDFFADDSTIHSSAPSIAKVNKELQAGLKIAVAWSKQNKLPINHDKTTYMVLGTKPKEHDTYLLDLNADGNKIEKVPKQKLLGIVIDDHLSWAPHIDYLCSTISSKISLLRHISIYVPQNIQKIFYQSYIQPLLDYGCNTWGNTTAANIERLSKLQKRAARIILRADFMTPSTIMFDRLEWLSVPKRLMFNKAVLTYKALNNLAPAYISGLLKPVSETHTRSLRSSENGLLSVPRSRTALYDRSFSYSASKLWNALPQSIRTKPSLKSFKTSLKAQFKT